VSSPEVFFGTTLEDSFISFENETVDSFLAKIEVVNKNFPRGVVIMANGKLNKIAVRLYEEFKKHDPLNEVA